MIVFLRFLFAALLVAMIAVTVAASFERGVFEAAADLGSDPWFRATLADARFGFLAVYLLWVLFRLPADAPMERVLLRPPREG